VQNLPVKQGGIPSNATALSLGAAAMGNAINNVDLKAVVSDSPQANAPAVAQKNFNVSSSVYNAQGNFRAPAPAPGQAPPAQNPNPNAPPVGAVTFAGNGTTSLQSETGVPNVNAADNQCGPMAVANGLKYLAGKGLSGTYNNIAGRGALMSTVELMNDPVAMNTVSDIPNLRNRPVYQAPDPRAAAAPPPENPLPQVPANVAKVPFAGNPNTGIPTPPTAMYVSNEGNVPAAGTLVGDLDLLAQRVSDNRPRFFYKAGSQNSLVDGNLGTSPQQQLFAAVKYLSNDATAKTQATVTFQYASQTFVAMADPGVAGITATDKSFDDGTNKYVTFDYIFQNVQKGNMVVLGRTGHATNVVAAGYTLDRPWIVMQSDFDQTPSDALDNTIGFGSGLEFSYLTRADPMSDYVLPNVEGQPIIQDVIVIAVPEPIGFALLAPLSFAILRRRSRR
jgi:hypothetical protein